MIRHDDDQLLETLAAALAPAPVEPTFAETVALRRAVAARAAQHRAGVLSRLRRPVPAAALAVALAGGVAGIAAVSGAAMPRPVRTVVRAVGVPVESAALARTRHDMHELREALRSGDPNAIRPAMERLRVDTGHLSVSDRQKVDDDLTSLLARADAALTPVPTTSAAATSAPATTTPVPAMPAAPSTTAAPAPPVRSAPATTTTSAPEGGDDHSGDGSGDNSGPGSTSPDSDSGSGSGHDGSGDGTSSHSGPG